MHRPARTSCSRCLCPDGRTIRHDAENRSGTLAPRHLIPVTNPIESVFATVRHRTVRTKGSLSPITAKLMVFKLVIAASRTWRRLKGTNQLPKVIAGVSFNDGIEVIHMPANHAA
ncbi:hypothetical protein ACVWXO_005532 [Bradyrhizobium sp. LM2.7]